MDAIAMAAQVLEIVAELLRKRPIGEVHDRVTKLAASWPDLPSDGVDAAVKAGLGRKP